MGRKRQTASNVEQHDESADVREEEHGQPTTEESTTPRNQPTASAAAVTQPKEGGERVSNASETPRDEELPVTPIKAKEDRVEFAVDELALERNKLFQLVVFVATMAVAAVVAVYNHKLVKAKADLILQRGTEFERQVEAKYAVRSRASDLYNVALEELDEFAVWRQVAYPRLRQAATVAGHIVTRVNRYFAKQQ